MEESIKSHAVHLSLIVEGVAALVIAIALLQFLLKYFPSLMRKDQYVGNTTLRVRFGSALAIALECCYQQTSYKLPLHPFGMTPESSPLLLPFEPS